MTYTIDNLMRPHRHGLARSGRVARHFWAASAAACCAQRRAFQCSSSRKARTSRTSCHPRQALRGLALMVLRHFLLLCSAMRVETNAGKEERGRGEAARRRRRNWREPLLVVDDRRKSSRFWTAKLLHGFELPRAPPKTGQPRSNASSRAPTLIVLDVGMPLMDGYAVCRRHASISPALSCFSPHASRTSTRWSLEPVPTTTC